MYKNAAIKNSPRRTRQGTINLRISDAQKELIDRAAQALGRNRSDFMLETACREAESVLLDRRYFALPELFFRQSKIAPIKQDTFRLPAGCFQHEIRAIPAKSLGSPINERFLASAYTNVDVFAASFTWLGCFTGHEPSNVHTINIH